MDSQDYLDQISREARPKSAGNKGGIMGILTSKYFKWGVGFVGALIVIMLFGALLSNRGDSVEDICVDLKLHLEQTAEVMTEYQPYVKSSSLRSLSASLKGVFTTTATNLTNYMTTAYGFEENKIDEERIEAAELTAEELSSELFEAKINGLLDRTYAHKMALEIYTVMGDEMGIHNSTDETELKGLLESSYTSLNNLYTLFNDFSETK